MTILQSTPLSADAIKVKWKEPYVTAALNQKSIAFLPKGVVTGFTVTPQSPLAVGVTLATDASSALSVANVWETTGGSFSVTLVLNAPVNISLASFAGQTVYIALDAQYVIGATTTAVIKVVDVAELTAPAGADLVLLAKVNVPGVGNVTTSNINMGYRDPSGDYLPPETSMHFNLIHNPTFEATATGWVNSGFTSVAASTDFAHTGGYSLKLVLSPAALASVTAGPMPVAPARSYRVGAWLHSPVGLTGGNGAKLQVGWYDAAGAQIGGWVDIETAIGLATASFVIRKSEVTAPTLALTAVLRVFFDNCSGTLYVDDVFFSSHTHDEVMKSAVFGGPGVSGDAFHTHTGAGLAYGGGVNWADGTTNPATTVEAQLDKILSDLAGASGAPKVGNAPSKILTNVFTQLNTFNNGITLGGGHFTLSGAGNEIRWNTDWTLVTDTSNFYVNSPQFFSNTGNIPYQFKIDTAGDSTQLHFADGTNTGFLGLSPGGAIINTWPGMGIGTAGVAPLDFLVNSTSVWRVDSGGVLTSVGGNRAIQGVLDPVTAQDAATKAYVDANAGTALNTVINGGMEYWQRGTLVTSNINVGSSIAGYNFHSYCADRWYAQTRDDAGGQPIAVDIRPFTVTGLSDTRRAIRIRNLTAGASSQFYQAVQELDRDTVVRLRGKKVSWRIAVRKGTSSPADADFFCELYSNTGAASQRLAAYTGGAGVGSSSAGGGALSTTNFTYFTGTSAAVIPAGTNGMSILFGVYHNGSGPADANDYLEFGEVSIVAGEAPPSKFTWASGGDAGAELNLCERYYEKTYALAFTPGTGGANGYMIGLGRSPTSVGIIPGVRFAVRKRATPAITFYSAVGGTAGLWDETGTPGAFAVVANSINDSGFYVTESAVGAGGNWHGPWVADAEI